MCALREVDLSHNTLGVSYGVPTNPKYKDKSPPICILGDVLINSKIEVLNISHNQMESKSAVSIAHGLRHTHTLRHVDISGNPIGQSGMRLVMMALNQNQAVSFEVNMKDISAEHSEQK